MGKARDFKNHVTPAVFSFAVTSTYVWPVLSFNSCVDLSENENEEA